jgi:hypothetical protein
MLVLFASVTVVNPGPLQIKIHKNLAKTCEKIEWLDSSGFRPSQPTLFLRWGRLEGFVGVLRPSHRDPLLSDGINAARQRLFATKTKHRLTHQRDADAN